MRIRYCTGLELEVEPLKGPASINSLNSSTIVTSCGADLTWVESGDTSFATGGTPSGSTTPRVTESVH